ncbi:peptidoglycan editing factor PgeF [Alkalimarinus coralli]|uniref:peptidoglycan editing factor PgeF n=1 Tax=Alkalimarinus coralli TaxID=2935863 RepID=UPI00202AD89E|nr:peptidoglycan editing factor PgeF [Alkalimarinus coralli]
MTLDESFIVPEWPLPENVRALCTTRLGGQSLPPFDSFNLGTHVGDSPNHVQQNRSKLAAQCGLSQNSLQWLNQVHGNRVCEAQVDGIVREADASFARVRETACVIMTADCLPVLLSDKQGKQVAAIHAGWRSLCSGVIEATLSTFRQSSTVTAWLGPAIGPSAFEVGQDVVDAFTSASCGYAEATHKAFSPIEGQDGKWLADLYSLARIRLWSQGISDIYGGGHCTLTNATQFYSYRRNGVTGRMASLIWMT